VLHRWLSGTERRPADGGQEPCHATNLDASTTNTLWLNLIPSEKNSERLLSLNRLAGIQHRRKIEAGSI